MKINGLGGMTAGDLEVQLQTGAKFVVYQYCISIIILTFKRSSAVYFIRSGESATSPGLKYTVLTALLGWWGIPWGPIYSVQSLLNNARGGRDVTAVVATALQKSNVQPVYPTPGT